MTVLGRFSELISMNLHAMLDRAENPERMLDHLLGAMDGELAAARLRAAKCIAAERRQRREFDECQNAASQWKEQARFALSQGREDLARRALARQLDYEQQLTLLEDQYKTASRASSQIKACLSLLKNRVAEARQRQITLIARQRVAELQAVMEQSLHGTFADLGSRLQRAERRLIDREEELLAEFELNRSDNELRSELTNLEREIRITEALDAMKKEVVGGS